MDAQRPMGQSALEIAGGELRSPGLVWNEFSSEENCARWPVALRWCFCFMEQASNQSKMMTTNGSELAGEVKER